MAVKVFISWSGLLSKQLAEAIRDWLPAVLQSAVPYFTPADIEKGARWSTDIAKELESSQVGIMCVTRDNLHSDWILFEAGALSKSLEKSHVCPIIFGITNTDLAGPLKQFQTTEFEKSDVHKLLGVINSRLGEQRLNQKTLDAVFEKWWPDLEKRVTDILTKVAEPTEPVRTDRELIEEILLLTRSSSRQRGPVSSPISSKAVAEVLNVVVRLHDDQAAEIGSYHDVLEILADVKKPLTHIANRFKGSSDEFDKAYEAFSALTYEMGSSSGPDDDDIPF